MHLKESTSSKCLMCRRITQLVTKNHCVECRPKFNEQCSKRTRIYKSRHPGRANELSRKNPYPRWKSIVREDARRDRACTLTLEQFKQFIAMPCEYCFFPATGVDRLDNAVGHVLGNMVPCCKECNLARGDRFTVEEMRKHLGPAIRKIKESR